MFGSASHSRRNLVATAVALPLLVALTLAPGAATNVETPNLERMQRALDGVTNYTAKIDVHEISNDGKTSEDRIFAYKFLKPSFVEVHVLAGAGKGGVAVWSGGPTLRGHRDGILSAFHATIETTDPRATSIRGDRIDAPSFGHQLEHFETTAGTLSDGKDGDKPAIVLIPDPAENGGVTRDELILDPQTFLPVERDRYVGQLLVKRERIEDLKVNPGLKRSDFEI